MDDRKRNAIKLFHVVIDGILLSAQMRCLSFE